MSSNFLARKKVKYVNTNDGKIFGYLCNYLVMELADIIIDYIIVLHGIRRDIIQLTENDISRIWVRNNMIYMQHKTGSISVMIFDNYIQKIFNGFNRLLDVTDEFLYVKKSYGASIIIYNHKYEYVSSCHEQTEYGNIRKFCYDKDFLYILGDHINIFTHNGRYVKSLNINVNNIINNILVDDNNIYIFSDNYFEIYDKQNMKKSKKINTDGFIINSCVLNGTYLICGCYNYVIVYDIEVMRCIKLIDLVEFNIFSENTKLKSISMSNNKLYILDNESRIHIIE